jgi:hypothetical protein
MNDDSLQSKNSRKRRLRWIQRSGKRIDMSISNRSDSRKKITVTRDNLSMEAFDSKVII